MKKTVLSLLISIFLSSAVFSGGFPYPRPDEGMWLPLLIEKLNYADMQRLGLKITAEDIYSVNHSSLKDAIVVFGGGCTGEIVSPEGLLLTNHHCGYGQIQAHSTVEHDYLTNGFWAKSKDQELPNPGLTVKFLVRMEDVSDIVLKDVDDGMTETERNKIIMTNISKIEADAKATGNFVVSVKSFFAGNKFYLLVYEEYKDVRLVGAPPSSIGKFGADTDNWMWPRHTGDFSIFRVYTDKEGKPAEYSPDNIPLKPKKYLNISLKGYKEG
ncbi:MAG: S46 family peptidase, partial [Sphingobacteriales bacterium]|nr:S46 family peptidase [Sphingobacteriales bacterium]